MKIDHNTIYYVIVGVLFLILKFTFKYMDNDALVFMIKPVSSAISLITNASAIYSNDTGFYFNRLNIIIDRSCSGYNFGLMCFAISAVSAVRFFKTTILKSLIIPIALMVAYIVTILVNISRILTSLLTQQTALNKWGWFHQLEGTFIYLLSLIGFYLLQTYLLNWRIRKNA